MLKLTVARFAVVVAVLLPFACGSVEPGPGPLSEQAFFEAVARSEVRYALITRAEGSVEARDASNALIRLDGVEDLDAVAALLAKEGVEHHVQQTRVAVMPE